MQYWYLLNLGVLTSFELEKNTATNAACTDHDRLHFVEMDAMTAVLLRRLVSISEY